MMTGHTKVDQLATLNLQGNIIPHNWFQNILMPSGKVDLNGIIILSEIVYWYRPTVQKDETTGLVATYKKRFKSDMLQRSYDSFANQFGLSKRQVVDAIKRLEEAGLIKRFFRNMTVNGTHMSNVLHIDINPSAVIAITNNRDYLQQKVTDNKNSIEGVTKNSDTSHEKVEGGISNNRDTSHAGCVDVYRDYSEITTEITQIYNDDVDERANEIQSYKFYEENGFGILTPHVGEMIDQWIDELNDDLVIHAMKIAIENNVLKWNYVNKILIDWSNKKYKTVADVLAAELQRRAQQSKRKPYNTPQREEQVPSWFNKEPEPVEESASNDETSEDVEALRRQLMEDLGIDPNAQSTTDR